jgi:hypothetical protein
MKPKSRKASVSPTFDDAVGWGTLWGIVIGIVVGAAVGQSEWRNPRYGDLPAAASSLPGLLGGACVGAVAGMFTGYVCGDVIGRLGKSALPQRAYLFVSTLLGGFLGLGVALVFRSNHWSAGIAAGAAGALIVALRTRRHRSPVKVPPL